MCFKLLLKIFLLLGKRGWGGSGRFWRGMRRGLNLPLLGVGVEGGVCWASYLCVLFVICGRGGAKDSGCCSLCCSCSSIRISWCCNDRRWPCRSFSICCVDCWSWMDKLEALLIIVFSRIWILFRSCVEFDLSLGMQTWTLLREVEVPQAVNLVPDTANLVLGEFPAGSSNLNLLTGRSFPIVIVISLLNLFGLFGW